MDVFDAAACVVSGSALTTSCLGLASVLTSLPQHLGLGSFSLSQIPFLSHFGAKCATLITAQVVG